MEFQKEFAWLVGQKLYRRGADTWHSFADKLKPRT